VPPGKPIIYNVGRYESSNIVREFYVNQLCTRKLPEESYDKEVFVEKRDNVFELALDLARNGLKWAA